MGGFFIGHAIEAKHRMISTNIREQLKKRRDASQQQREISVELGGNERTLGSEDKRGLDQTAQLLEG